MPEKRGIYTRRAHSVFRLTYHAVFVVKYRRKDISPGIMGFMEQHTKYLIEERFRGVLKEFNGEPDHIHVLFELPPSAAPSMAICSLKTQLSREVRKRYAEQIREKLWKDSFWSDSYFLATTGGADIETLERYIRKQGVEKSGNPKKRMVWGRIHPHPTIVGWGVLLLLDKIIHNYISFLKLLF